MSTSDVKTADLHTMTRAEFIAEAKALRAAADEAEERYLEFLYQMESKPEIWRDGGRSYIEVLEHDVGCAAIRYARYKRVREALGIEALRGAGVHGIIAAGALRTQTAQRELLDRARHFQETNGTPPSERSAQDLLREQKLREAVVTTRNSSYAVLVEQCEKLRARVKELESQNAALRAEIRTLKKRRSSAKSAA